MPDTGSHWEPPLEGGESLLMLYAELDLVYLISEFLLMNCSHYYIFVDNFGYDR